MKHARNDYQERIQDSAGLIPEDEPVLLIRGQDRAAIPAAEAWIEAHLALGGDPALAEAIDNHIKRIEDWQATVARKVADAPPEVFTDTEAS